MSDPPPPPPPPPVSVQHWHSVQIPVRSDQVEPPELPPVRVPEMKMFGIWNPQGTFLGQRFLSSSGTDTNVLFSNDLCPGALIYQGTRRGLRAAVDAAGPIQNADEVNAWIFGVSDLPLVWGPPPPGYRKAEIRPRFVDRSTVRIAGRILSETSHQLNLSTCDVAAILVPVNRLLSRTPIPGGYTEVPLKLILEQVPDIVSQDTASSEINPRRYELDDNAILVSRVSIVKALWIRGIFSTFHYLTAINILNHPQEQDHIRTLSKIVARGEPPKESELNEVLSRVQEACQDLPVAPAMHTDGFALMLRVAKELCSPRGVATLRNLLDMEINGQLQFRCLQCLCAQGIFRIVAKEVGCHRHADGPLVAVTNTNEGKKLYFTN